MNISAYLENKIAAWIRSSTFPSAPTSLTVALSSADPTDDGSGLVEPTDLGYARQTVTFGSITTTEPDGSAMSNSAGIVFTGTALGVVTHAAIFDNTGHMLFYGPLDVARDVINNDTVSFAATVIRITLAGAFSKYLAEAILSWVRGTTMPAAPVSLLLAISTASANRDALGIAEPSGHGYARQVIAFGAPSETVGIGTQIANSANIIFGPNTISAWGIITSWALFGVAGNLLAYGQLAVPKNVTVGAGFGIGAGALSLLIR